MEYTGTDKHAAEIFAKINIYKVDNDLYRLVLLILADDKDAEYVCNIKTEDVLAGKHNFTEKHKTEFNNYVYGRSGKRIGEYFFGGYKTSKDKFKQTPKSITKNLYNILHASDNLTQPEVDYICGYDRNGIENGKMDGMARLAEIYENIKKNNK